MIIAPAGAATGRHTFTLTLSFLSFGTLNFVTLCTLFVAGLTSIAETWFRNHWALTVTHLFTLGYVTAIIMGAMYQLVPVILETRLWSERLGYVHLVSYLVGVVILLSGFWTMSAPLLAAGGSLVLAGVALFIFNMAATMRSAKHWHDGATFLVFALYYLAFVAVLGLLLALNVNTGFFGGAVRGHLVMHAAVGFGGWFTQTIMGVAYRLVPLFTLSHHKPGLRTRAVLVLTNLGITALAVAAGFGAPGWVVAGALALGGAGVVIFLMEMLLVIRRRVRKELDLGVRFAIAAFVALLATLVLSLAYPMLPPEYATPARAVGLIYAAGIGWVSLMVVGHMYKIVPFLIWTSRHAARVGKEPVPLLKDMYDERSAAWAFRTLVTGVALVTAGLWITWLPLATVGAALSLAGTLLFSWSVATIYRR